MVVSSTVRRVLAPVAFASLLSATSFASQVVAEPVPRSLADAVAARLGEEVYDAHRTSGGWEAASRGGLQEARFAEGRVELRDRSGAERASPFALELVRAGRAGAARPVAEAEVVVDGRFVEYRRGPLTEWYVSDERGLEQGFTLDTPPAGEGPLELRVAVRGDYVGEPIHARAMRLASPRGPAVEYADLAAWDATGRELDAWLGFAREDACIVLRVDDAGATYPVTVDPIVTFEEAQLVGSDSVAGDLFGASISLSGDYAIVGAPRHMGVGEASGAAYVFVRSGTMWTEDAILTASDAAAFDLFGRSVAIFDRQAGTVRAVVGAPADPDLSGSTGKAYAFVRTAGTWSEQAILTASDAAGDDQFGYSVAISPSITPEESILVGAPGNDDAGSSSGAAYVFRRAGVTWPEEQKLVSSDAGPLDMYGAAVSIFLERLVIGAPGEDVACTDPVPQNCDSGAAYAYERVANVWGTERKLTAGEPATEDQFGSSVAIYADVILVGAPFDDDEGLDAGTAYAFARSGGLWPQEGQLLPGVLQQADDFGRSVCLDGNVGLVGAPETDTACPLASCDSGSAFVFLRQGAYLVGTNAVVFDGLAVDANTGTVYGASGSDLYTLDPASGAETLVGGFLNGVTIQGLAYDPNTNTLYGTEMATQTLHTINTATGEATPVGAGSSFISGLAFDPNSNTLYGTGPIAMRLFTINTANGATSAVGAPGSLGTNTILDLAFDETTDTLYGYDNVEREIFEIDTATGETKTAGSWGTFGTASGLAFDPATDRLYGSRVASPALIAVTLPVWTQQAELVPAFTAAGDMFGEAVSMGDGLAGVGAPFRNATGTAHIFQVGSGANLCADAHHISGEGLFLFDNTGASTDGDPHPSCVFPNAMDQNFSDVWYRWTAECTTDVTVRTCGLTAVDTQIAVYDGAACPATTSRLLVCDNDLSPCGPFGAQTEVVFPVEEGEEYLIRIGSASSAASRQGSGLMEIEFVCPLCPANTVASTWQAPSAVELAGMLGSLHRLRDAMRTTPHARRLVNLYYRHADEMSRILREEPRLRRLVLALIDLLHGGVHAATTGAPEGDERVVTGQVVALLETVLDGFEDASGEGELARAIRAERERFDVGALAGKSYAEALEEVLGEEPSDAARSDAGALLPR